MIRGFLAATALWLILPEVQENRMHQDSQKEMDFAALLEESLSQELPSRGDIVTGTILAIDRQGLLVDVGLKSDGLVGWSDIERLGDETSFSIGDEVLVLIGKEDSDGNLLVSISQAQQAEDWDRATKIHEEDDVWKGKIVDANRGGVLVQFGYLRGFVPASHIVSLPRDLNEDDRKYRMKQMIGQPLVCKVLEVNQKRRRLILSEREAQREKRQQRKEDLLEKLTEGDVIKGVVSGMRDFGAFVDLGGADGLIHISELAWHRINHPREIVSSGQELDVYVLRLDQETKRIELSLKRMQENPWATIEEKYHIGQLVEGNISRVTDFGAFIALEPGIEGLLHSNHLADPIPESPKDVLNKGENVLVRVISIESENQRLGLSLRDVTENEWANWQAVKASESTENSLQSTEEVPVGAAD